MIGDDDARSRAALPDRATAASPPAARWSGGRGACSAASGASRSWSWRSSPSRSRPRSAASRSSTTRAPRTTPSSARPATCSGSTAPIRERSRRAWPRPRVVRDDGGHRPPLGARTRQRRDRGLPRPGPGRRLRRRAARAPQGRYPAGPGEVAVTDGVAELLALELGATLALDGRRRDRRRHRREPARSERRVRPRLPGVRGRAGPRHAFWSTRATSRSTPSSIAWANAPVRFTGTGGAPNDGGGHAGDVLRGHRLPAPGLARCRRGLRRHRAAAAPPARHARRDRRDAEAPPPRAAHQRRRRRRDRRIFGTIAGLALWVVFAPTLESAFDHRIDRLSLPGLLASSCPRDPRRDRRRLVAGANRRPLPVTLALSGRPPEPRPARHSAIAAAALIAVGIGCLALSDRDRPPLIVAGILATILGTLLLGPLAIRTLLRGGWARPDRAALGAARPRPLPGPFRGGARGGHTRPRHRGGGRRRRRGRGRRGGRRARPTCPTARSASTPGRPESGRPRAPDARPASHGGPRASASSPQVSIGRP